MVLVFTSAVLALLLRENLTLDVKKLQDLTPYIFLTIAAAIPLHRILALDQGFWDSVVPSDCARIVLGISLTVFGATAVMFLINRMDGISRSVPILQALIAIFALVGVRVLSGLLPRGQGAEPPAASLAPVELNMRAENVLIVGVNRLSLLLLQQMEVLSSQAHVAGFVALDANSAGRGLLGYPVFPPEENFPLILRKLALHGIAVDRILVAVNGDEMPARMLESLRRTCEAQSIRIEYVKQALENSYPVDATRPAPLAECEELQRLRFQPDLIRAIVERPYWKAKRLLDVIMAGVFLVALAPLLLGLVLLVRATLRSPVWFWQIRTGFNGRRFRLYKFRTMIEAYGGDGKPIDDSLRQNAIGRFLRATRLDELPQLWNILRGEMSFIGPRPLLPVDQLNGASFRCLVRPGLTGWAQVMGGRNVDAADKMALDMWYVQNASPRLDIEILGRTILVLLFGERVRRDVIRHAWDELRRAGAPLPLDQSTVVDERGIMPIGLWEDRTKTWSCNDLQQGTSPPQS